jgi:predicted amidohydrolase
VLVARAVENGIPLVAADVAGRQGERVCHGTTTIIDSQGTIVAAARQLEEDFIVADVALDGVRGGMDGQLTGRANPTITAQFLALWS